MKREYLMHELKEYMAGRQLEPVVFESQLLRSATRHTEEEELQDFIETNRKPPLQQVLFSFIDETRRQFHN